jgi:hypothetical protein
LNRAAVVAETAEIQTLTWFLKFFTRAIVLGTQWSLVNEHPEGSSDSSPNIDGIVALRGRNLV